MSEAGVSDRGPARVARSEAELLTLARAIVNPAQRYIPSLRQRPKHNQRLREIGPTAMRLLQQTLARGVSLELLRRGGWETRRTLIDGQPRRGRLWERHVELPPLRFGRASFELLAWLRAEDVAEPKATLEHIPNRSVADELLHYFAIEQIVEAGGSARQPAFLRSPLCQLGWAAELAGDQPLPKLDFRPLCTGEGAIVVEALQSDLAARYVGMEESKAEITRLATMIRVGDAQSAALGGLLRACDRVEPRRRELAGFIAEAGRTLLARGPERHCPDHRFWIRGLDLRASLSERQAAFAAAAAFLRALCRLGQWLDEAGVVAHFDDDYEAAQLLLSSWAFLRRAPEPASRVPPGGRTAPPIPAAILERAALLANQLESLHSLGATVRPSSPAQEPS